MPGHSAHRWAIREYAPPVDLVKQMSDQSGLSRPRVRELLQSAGERVAKSLSFSQSPLLISADGVRAIDFAGLLRVAPRVELEVMPKFLGTGTVSKGWREDFFLLSTLSRHGQLLGSDRLRTLSSRSTDLASLVGRALSEMYWDNHRRPLRTYRRQAIREFAVEGELEPDALLYPEADGYEQVTLQYTRQNDFNAAISAAALELSQEVVDAGVRSSLERITHLLSPQRRVTRPRNQRLPARSRRWQSTHDLAIDVLRGLGLSYLPGYSLAPGYVADTWRIWEDLVTLALRTAFGGTVIVAQRKFLLGQRSRVQDGATIADGNVFVKPDVAVSLKSDDCAPFLVDAKYKGRSDIGPKRISESDAYEALAFMTASGCKTVVLCYPRVDDGANRWEIGRTKVFDVLNIDGKRIIGIDIEVSGIAGKGALQQFAAKFSGGVKEVALLP